MTECGEIGDLIETLHEAQFEWRIQNFMMLPKEVDTCYTSPYFYILDTSWYLAIYPNGLRKHESVGSIGMYLHRGDSGPPKTVQYMLGIKQADGMVENVFAETVEVSLRGAGWGIPDFLSRLTIEQRLSELVPLNTLTIVCHLKCSGHHSLQDGRSNSDRAPAEGATTVKDISHNETDSASFDLTGVTVLAENLKDFLLAGQGHDVVMMVKGQEFRAHTKILQARLPAFARMFNHDTTENNPTTIFIEDCDPDAFTEFLQYVYSGKTENLTPKIAVNLYCIADKFDFSVLTELCVIYLKKALCNKVICDVVHLAEKYKEEELYETAVVFFVQNKDEILRTDEWECFMKDYPDEADDLDIKSIEIMRYDS